MTAAKKAAPAKKSAPAKRAAPVAASGRASSGGRSSIGGSASTAASRTPAKKVAVATKAAPAKKGASPATKAPAKKAAAATKAPAKKVAAATKAPAKHVPPATKAAPPTKAVPAKKAPAAPAAKPDPTKRSPARRAPAGPYADDPKFLEEQRILLLEERAVYQGQAEDLRAEADSLALEREPGDVQFDEESGEGGTVAVDRERDLALSAQALAAVEEIDDALAKIDRKTYGACERCHEPIPKARLRALPYARLCVACKSGGLSRR